MTANTDKLQKSDGKGQVASGSEEKKSAKPKRTGPSCATILALVTALAAVLLVVLRPALQGAPLATSKTEDAKSLNEQENTAQTFVIKMSEAATKPSTEKSEDKDKEANSDQGFGFDTKGFTAEEMAKFEKFMELQRLDTEKKIQQVIEEGKKADEEAKKADAELERQLREAQEIERNKSSK